MQCFLRAKERYGKSMAALHHRILHSNKLRELHVLAKVVLRHG